MTVASETPINTYVANGATSVFAFTFRIEDETELAVYVDEIIQVSGFSVSGVGVNGGGSVTFNTNPASASVVVLLREMPDTRTIDYQNSGDFRADTVNEDIDRVWLRLQQMQRDIDYRMLQFPLTKSRTPSLNELPTPEATKVLAWGPSNEIINVAYTVNVTDQELVSVGDLASLRSLSPSEYAVGSVVTVANQGQDGQFKVVSGVATDDDRNIISSAAWASASKHWQRLFSSDVDFYSVESAKEYDLKSGQIVSTYSFSDDWLNGTSEPLGSGSYQVLTLAEWQSLTSGVTPDGFGDHLADNGNVLKLLKKNELTVEMFSAVGDGVTDDTNAINASLAYSDFIYANSVYKTTLTTKPKGLRGSGKIILVSPLRTEWISENNITDIRTNPSGFSFVPNYNLICLTFGQAQHNIDVLKQFEKDFSLYFGTLEYWVDPVNGLDTNSGSVFAPFKTLKKAYQASSPSVIRLKSGTYTDRFFLEYSDNNVASLPRPIRIIGMGEVIFRAPGDQPSALTWTLDATYSVVTYTATPSGSETVNAILWEKDGLSTLLPYYSVGADLASVNLGWFQDSSTKDIHIKLGGFNVETFKATLEIMYSRGGQTLGTRGTRTYLENVTFRGDGSFYCIVDGSSRRSHLYQKNVTYEYLEQMNFRTEGSTAFSQNCISRFSLNGDGFNYYDEGGTAGGEISNVLEIDCQAYSNGRPITNLDAGDPSSSARTWDGGRNKQGSSGHNSSIICRINGEYYDNFGQNIADTGATSKTWMIGSIIKDVYAELWNVGLYGTYPGLWTEGDAYLDTVQSGGVTISYGFFNQSGNSYHFNCNYKGQSSDLALIAGSIGALEI